jgi:ATP-dependent Lon protease
MTGEISLSGVVLPVGGIKEKVLGAKRAGIREVILPADNEPNVKEDLLPHMLEGVKIHYVHTLDQALDLALGPAVPAAQPAAPAGSKPADRPTPIAAHPVH